MGTCYSIKAVQNSVLATAPPFSRVRMTMVRDPVQAQVLAEKILTLLLKGVIKKIDPDEQLTGFYSIFSHA